MTTQRRRRAWCDILINLAMTNNASIVPVDLLVDFPDVDVKTVTRIIGDLTVFPDDRNGAIDSVQQVDVGIGVGSQEAFSAGVVPDPNVQAEYPTIGWLYITTQVLVWNNSSGTNEVAHIPTWHFDIGSNRKVDKGVLWLAAHNTGADGSGLNVRMIGRVRSLCLT